MTKGHSPVAFFFDRVVLRHPKTIIFVVLAVVGLLAFQVRHFNLDASAETLVLENDEDLRYSRVIGSRYGQQDFLVMTYTPRGDLLSPDTLATLARLRDDLSSLDRVSSVLSVLDVPLLESPPIALKELTGDLPTLESPTVDKDLARTELRDSPLYQSLLVSSDLQTTALLVSFEDDQVYRDLRRRRDELRQKKASGALTPAERAELKLAVQRFRDYRDEWRQQRHQDIMAMRAIMDKYRGEAELFLGGVGMIADDMITFIKNDLKVFGIGVLLFLILMLGIIFKGVRWICLPMLCCVVSAICMIGLLGWLGWEVTVVSANFISLQLIMTMAIAIHLIVRYRELLAQNPQAPNHGLILNTIRLKLKPCLYAVLTTIAGFGSLVLCDVLPVIMFGWMMTVGLIVSLIVTFLLFPAVLILIPKAAPRSSREWRFSVTSILARFTEGHGALIVGVGGLVLIVSLIGISKLDVENCFIDYFDESTEIYQGMKTIDQRLGGTTPMDVIVEFGEVEAVAAPEPAVAESDDEFDEFDEFDELDEAATDEKYWFTAEKMSRVKAVHQYLDELPATGKVVSLATMLSIVEKLNGGEPLDSFELALLYNETPDEFKTTLVSPYVSVEHNQVRFWVRVRDSEKTLRRNELLQKVKADLTGKLALDEDRVHLTGMLVLYNNMLQSLFGSQILTLGITVLVLTGMFLVLFRSARIAAVAMFANVLPIAAVLGMMGWLSIPLDMMTITIAAIGVGIAVDDTIHYIHRFKDEFQKDHKYMNTMHRCHGSIGHAMYYTSVTIIIGFSILALSNFIPSVYFGLLTGLAMFIALLAALTLLPQMLILVKPFGKEA
ncbi:MAG: MMPL family transporter [Phycisphaerales bacterium]|nr:MAG: MMPL family transporter [Phycisphaerales bacterium]